MLQVNFDKLVCWFVDNNITVQKAVDIVTVVYWGNLNELELALSNYEIFNFDCKYDSYGESMLFEYNKRHLAK